MLLVLKYGTTFHSKIMWFEFEMDGWMIARRGRLAHAEQLRHFRISEALPRDVRLDPLPIHHKLRNCALSGVADDLLSRAGHFFNIDLPIWDFVVVEPSPGDAAIATPWGRVNNNFHSFRFVGLDVITDLEIQQPHRATIQNDRRLSPAALPIGNAQTWGKCPG